MNEVSKTGLRVRIAFAAFAMTGLVGYLVLALTDVGISTFWVISAVSFVGFAATLGRFLSAERLATTTLALGMVLGLTLVGDTAVMIRRMALTTEAAPEFRASARMKMRDILPPTYRKASHLPLHRPGFSARARVAGAAYDESGPQILESERLRDVLEDQVVEYTIDEHGWRASTPWETTQIVAVGDSFTFGVSAPPGVPWTDQLAATTGQRVYNMGFNGAWPRLELDQLDDMIETNGRPDDLHTIVWMLFEGNDLEESKPIRPFESIPPLRIAWRQSPIYSFFLLVPGQVRAASQLRHWLEPAPVAPDPPPYTMVDDVRISGGLYNSPVHGDRWFYYTPYVERARYSAEDVANHPHRPHLDSALEEIAARAESLDVRLVWVIAPSATRLYAPHFEDFPAIPNRPHFVEYLKKRTAELGGETIDLLEIMKPLAKKEMLYLTDDTHWNRRGNEVAAEAIAAVVTSSVSRGASPSDRRSRDR